MASETKIEWADTTWNPVVGCSAVSAGCKNCYAARMTRRLEAMGRPEYAGLVGDHHFNGTFRELPDRLDEPRRWKKPRRVFVNSMSDLFGEGVSDEFISSVFETMRVCRHHTFQVLTKRPERAAAWFGWLRAIRRTSYPTGWPLPNVWIGTSVENQEAADARIPHLIEIPARVRFLSCEPLLGPVDLTFIRGLIPGDRHGRRYQQLNALNGYAYGHGEHPRYKGVEGGHSRINWVIAGGESGPRARPMHPDWARGLRDQCVAAAVPYFHKQNGEFIHVTEISDGGTKWEEKMERIGKKAAGRLLDGREWNEFPQEAPDGR